MKLVWISLLSFTVRLTLLESVKGVDGNGTGGPTILFLLALAPRLKMRGIYLVGVLLISLYWPSVCTDDFPTMESICATLVRISSKAKLCANDKFINNCGVHVGCPGSSKPTQVPTTRPSPTTRTTPKRHCDKRSPCMPMSEANAKFAQRCKAQGLPDSCVGHCNYDEAADTRKGAFTSTKECSLNDLRKYLSCASDGKDNTACCDETGVLAQRKTGVCGVFCNPNGPVWPTKREALRYAPCVNVLSGIMQCHYFAQGAD